MNTLVKNAMRLPVLKCAGKLLKPSVANFNKIQVARSTWHLSSYDRGLFHHKCNSKLGHCTCGLRNVHSKGEKELADFLIEEISAERKLQKVKNITQKSDFEGFKVTLSGSEVTLLKRNGDETVEINFNINHTVDAETVEPEIEPTMDKPELGEMKSRPSFEVEIRRGGQTFGFTCSTVSPAHQQQDDSGYNDLFMIDEVVMYEGEWNDSNYSVSGDVLDGTLYDLFMNLLEDKGITNEFVEKLIDFSTAYEHDSYIRMLESVHRFVTPK